MSVPVGSMSRVFASMLAALSTYRGASAATAGLAPPVRLGSRFWSTERGKGGRGAVALGAGAGLLGAVALSRGLRALLFEVAPADPVSIAAAIAIMMLVSAVAAYGPARRAARVDPMEALRTE